MKYLKLNTVMRFATLSNKLLLLGLVACLFGHAQLSSFKNFGLDKGTFPSRIECISQGNSGELHIGTLAGLVVYDGNEFNVLSEKDGLAENAVSSLCNDEASMWVGHWAGNLSEIDQEDNSIKTHNIAEQLNFSSIIEIYSNDSNHVWLVNRRGELYSYRNNQVEQLAIPKVISGERVLDVIDAQGIRYVLTNRRLFEVGKNDSETKWIEVFHSENAISSAFPIQSKEWVIGFNAGGVILNLEDDSLDSLRLKGERITDISQDREEWVWVGTASKGVYKFHVISRQEQWITRDNGLSYNEVRSLFVDREGQPWVATAAGLDQYLGSAFSLTDTRAGLPDNLIWDFLHLNGSVVVACPSGLYNLNMSGQRVANYSKYSLGNEEPRQILHTRKGTYVVTAQGGIWIGGENLKTFIKLSDVSVKTVCAEDVNGQIWLGTDEGIIKLLDGKPSEQYTIETGLGGNSVNGIYYNKVNNETWITSLGAPVTLYKDNRFRKYDESTGLTSKVIQDVAFDKDGNPWLATYDQGIFYLKNDSFVNLDATVEVPSNSTFAIGVDSKQRVWVGHNAGLFSYNLEYEELTQYGSNKGFLGVEVNPKAINFDADQIVWTGTLMGLLRFDPSAVRTNISEPVLKIKSATLGGENIIQEENTFQVDYDNSILKVIFSGVSLTNPQANTYKYRLVGAHDSWRVQDSQNPIEYVSLPPGDFQFEIVACNSDGLCNAQPSLLSFSIKPPFYKTWWFYSILFIAFIVFVYLMDRFRLLALLDEKNELKQQIALREDSIADLQEEISLFETENDVSNSIIDRVGDEEWTNENRPHVFQKNLSNRSSDHVFRISIGKLNIYGLIDLGVSASASDYLMVRITKEIELTQMKEPIKRAGDLFKLIDNVLEGITTKLDKHPGFSWSIVCENSENGNAEIGQSNGVAFQIMNHSLQSHIWVDEGVSEMSLKKEGRLVMVSDGLIEQISEDGTRQYSIKRLESLISQNMSSDSEELLETISADIADWMKQMEQTDDITVAIFNL